MSDLTNILISWYLINKRDLPWRATADPYRIWLSEIILQQTRIAQGLPYYERFINQFPVVEELAKAPEDEVLKLWQGLGYYSRARNLHATAKYVTYELGGEFPTTYKELKTLKGVGDYTASAIASFCFNESAAVVDGNVYRVLSRLYGIETPINTGPGQREFKTLAQELIKHGEPSTFNQAIMEFGAIQCKPKNPYCLHCPFNERCVAFRENRIEQLPVKKGKTKVRERHLNYLVVITDTQTTLLEQRKGKGIWRGLYQFPLLETKNELKTDQILEELTSTTQLNDALQLRLNRLQKEQIQLYNKLPVIHKLSHQKLLVKFWVLHLNDLGATVPGAIKVEDIQDYAVPRVIDRFLEDFDFD